MDDKALKSEMSTTEEIVKLDVTHPPYRLGGEQGAKHSRILTAVGVPLDIPLETIATGTCIIINGTLPGDGQNRRGAGAFVGSLSRI